MNEQQIWEEINKHDVKYLSMQFSDIHGTVKEIVIPTDKLDDALKHGIWFDGSSIEGFTRIQESDLYIKPDLDTFAMMPIKIAENDEPTARFICDTYNPDGTPFTGGPRYVLKQALAKAKEMGFSYHVGPEVEFYLFKNGNALDKKSYFDIFPAEGFQVLKEIGIALKKFGIDVEAIHHEVGSGQYEIDFRYSDALTIADQVITLKYVVRRIANLHGFTASFMPKPVFGAPGSGMHTHMSLADVNSGENAFYDENDNYGLSETAYHFIGGLIEHIKAACALTNPTVNSYKRLVPGYEAPVYIVWGSMNRSALIRIPRWFKGKKSSARLELRNPDPSCNPYLAFAATLMSGLDGIRRKIVPPDPVEENVYVSEKLTQDGEHLPTSLFEALQYMRKDPLMKETLGDHLFERYYSSKMREWNEFRVQVTPWELDKYLENA